MKNFAASLLFLAATSGLLAASDTRLPVPATDNDFYEDGRPSPEKVELGRLLFFDKVLSGNQNIACATCHHPELASGDGIALAWGEGPRGLGPDRTPGAALNEAVYERVPRNAPALFNLGAREFTTLFHDGRVEADPEGHFEGGFITPAKWKLPRGLENALAAQAMFPVASPTEMAGQKGENQLADAVSLNNVGGRGGLWEAAAQRLQSIPEYVERFRKAFPERVDRSEDISYVLAANAIAAFEATAFRADQSPFDQYLRGEAELSSAAQRGLELFYGKADCSSCHSGTFQTDQDFHAIAMPQIGPGKSDGWDSDYWSKTGIKAFPEDFGRGRETSRPEDRYKFRTPSLRNVELTGPWGHAGAFTTLESVVRHHLDPIQSLRNYQAPLGLLSTAPSVLEQTASGSKLSTKAMSKDRMQRYMERDTWVLADEKLRLNLERANELRPIDLSDAEVADLLAFLRALTDPRSRDLVHLVPDSVPSGLAVAD